MIKETTTLILGAGASIPFGFPSGWELLDRICTHARTTKCLRDLGFEEDLIRQFIDTLRESGKVSVDAFLEHRQEFMDVGKAAIATWLIQHERQDQLFNPTKRPHWYDHLYAAMNADPADFPGNNISIITFNYDRSLEQYLMTALMNSYDIPREEAAHIISAIKIVHVHGQLGVLPELAIGDQESRAYTPTTGQLRTAAEGIKVIHEGMAIKPEFVLARQIINDAQRICFLGFGFDQTNLYRLGLLRELGQAQNSHRFVTGSAFDLTRAEKNQVNRALNAKIELGRPTDDCLAFLRDSSVLK